MHKTNQLHELQKLKENVKKKNPPEFFSQNLENGEENEQNFKCSEDNNG